MAAAKIVGLTSIVMLITGTITAPAPGTSEIAARQAIVQPADTASCVVEHIKGTNFAKYDVHIGRPYNGGSGCGDVYAALMSGVAINDWRCREDEAHTGTALHFSTGDDSSSNDKVIAGLQVGYPTIAFQAQGICFKNYGKRSEQKPEAEGTRSTMDDETKDPSTEMRKSTSAISRIENPWCNHDAPFYLSVNDVSNGNGIFGVSKEFCASHHGVLPIIHGNTQGFNIYPGMSVLLATSNFCEGVDITEQECIDNFWIAGNSCKDEKVYPEGVHMYGATYMTECAGYSVVPFSDGSRVQDPELFKCWDITCVPGPAGDEQCRNSSSRCANGCSSGGKCVA